MKKRFVLFIMLFLCCATLCAQTEQVERELVKARVVNPENVPAVGFRAKMTPENIETTTDETGYFELNSSTKNTNLYIYNPYTPNHYSTFSITFTPDDSVDTIHLLTINWWVEGKIVDVNGNPIPNIVVEVIGQNKTSTTSSYGEYKLLNVTSKDRLRISDPNMFFKEKEVNVAFNDKETRIVLTQYIPTIFASRKDTTGVMYITDKTPQSKNTSIPEIRNIKSIKYSKDGYTIKEINRTPRLRGKEVQYRSGMSVSWVGRLPELQKEYAQGETNGTALEWRGAGNNEIYSWGPAVKDLEYSTTTSYPYDRNGSLVPKGSGNGMLANTYDSKNFFRAGISYKNEVDAKLAFLANSVLSISLSQNKVNSPIPNSYLEAYKGGVAIEKIQTGRFSSDVGLILKHTHEKLMNNGSSYAQFLQAIYTTPATFDNANGLSRKDAVKNSNSWQLANGSMRSYAPALVYNPFYIVADFPDRENLDDLLAYAKTKYTLNRLEVEGLVSYSKQWSNRTTRNSFYSQFTRNSELADLNAGINASYKLSRSIELKLSYLFDKNDESYEYKTPAAGNEFSRQSNQLSYAMYLKSQYINVDLTNKHYFSNTANSYTNLFPSLGINVPLENIFDSDFFYDFSLFGSVSRTPGEAPLLYKNKAALSTSMHSSQFRYFYEWQEIPFNSSLKPEIYTNVEVGLKKRLLHSRLFLEATYFNNTTSNFIAPYVLSLSSVSLQNIGRVHSYGYLFSASYRIGSYYSKLSGGIDLGFSSIRNKVSSVNNPNTAVALAGFSNIRTVFAENEPLGAIYGTSYQRNANGQLVVGNDGFPLVNYQLKKIGDPTPDFQLSLAPNLRWKFLTLTMVMEYSHGGDRWNGTRAYLDYVGMSKESAELRNTTGYVYNGITQSGSQNTVAVDFYNPATSLYNNRWVRYGAEGVGEDYIEDATYFRLRELSLSCNLRRLVNNSFLRKAVKDLDVEARLHNLILITGYKGVDPESTLFDYASGKGLDLFNIPSSCSFSFSVNLKF